METKVEALEDNKVKVEVVVDAADISSRVKDTYKDFANRYNFPGFRKGHAPRPIIDNALGKDAVVATVTDDVVNSCYPLAIDQCELYPVGQPEFEDAKMVEDGQDYSFTFTVEVKPSYELTSYDPIDVSLPPEGASEAEVDDQLSSLREHYYRLEPTDDPEAVIEARDCADLAMRAVDDKGEVIEALTTDDRPYTLGEKMMTPEFDEQLMGLKKGDGASFSIDMPDDPPAMILPYADQTSRIDFTIKVNTIKKRVLPELTDEWVQETLGFEGVEDLRRILRDSIVQQKQNILPGLQQNAALDAIGERFEGEAPESMREESESRIMQSFFQQLNEQGITFDSYLADQGITSDQFKADVKEQAAENAKEDLALDAWAAHYDLHASDDEVLEEFEKAGVEDPKGTMEDWRRSGELYVVREAIVRNKAIEHLIKTANVTEIDTTKKPEEREAEEADAE